jgi:pimeloyl-ACP methyl ester carboxylesterase
VLVAGGDLDAHASFGRIYHNYKGRGRICMYDRAGLGQSSFNSPKTRTLKELSTEWHELSQRQQWGSAILVAHSFGGFIARAYASDHPVQVRGLLLLDVAHEDWLPRFESKDE